MYIRRKVFSRIWDEETNEEKLFSVNETILSEEGIEDREFSKTDNERRKEERGNTKLRNSHKGLKRSWIVGGVQGGLAAYATKKGVDQDYKEGLSDDEIIKRAGHKGGKYGALGGMALGAALAQAPEYKILAGGDTKKRILITGGLAGLGGISGALGGKYGARANADSRLSKRAKDIN